MGDELGYYETRREFIWGKLCVDGSSSRDGIYLTREVFDVEVDRAQELAREQNPDASEPWVQ
jgi:hypothetical protein